MTAHEDTGARQGLAEVLRDRVQVGSFGPNAITVLKAGGKVSITPREADAFADAMLAWVLGVLEDEGMVEAVYDAGDAAHDTQRHIHASECCWPPPNAATTALAAVARVLTERAS